MLSDKVSLFFYKELLHFEKYCDIVKYNVLERKIIMFKRWMALILASAMVLSLAACGGKEDEETTKKNEEVVATDNVTNEDGKTEIAEDDDVSEDSEEASSEEAEEDTEAAEGEEDTEAMINEGSEEVEDETTKKGNSSEKDTTKKNGNEKNTTKKNNTENKNTTKKNNTDKTTTKKNTNKTTTKKTTEKEDSFKVPSGKVAIVNAYKKAANKTKAQNNMKIDKTCDVDINIEKFANKALTRIAKSVASFFMNQAKGEVETEVFVSGKPTKNTKKKNGKYVADKSTFIPIYGESYMCTLDPANVKSAKVTKKTDNTYSVEIVLKDDKCSITGVPKITVSGMDYFNPALYTEDMQGIDFTKGTVYYTECVIKATIDKDGYLDYAKHDMKLKTDDTVVELLGFDIDAALSGRYVTTFKFY